jgi:hypothetical protein
MLSRGRVRFALLLLVGLLACLPFAARSIAADAPAEMASFKPELMSTQAPVPVADEGQPRKVVIGVYINQVKSISMLDNEFVVDFWLWFRFKTEKDTPPAEVYKPLDNWEIIGGVVESKQAEQTSDLDNGETYAAVRIIARIKKFFDVTRFPVDNHTLRIEIEDNKNEDHIVRFEPDKVNSQIDPGVRTPGWNWVDSRAMVDKHTYTTNYGDNSLPTGKASSYSRFGFEIDLERPGLGYLFKLFWSIYLAVIIGFVALLIKPTDLDPRFGLGVGAIFAAAASAYVVNAALPPTNVLTLSDKVNMIAVGFIFLSLLESIFSLRFYYKEKVNASKMLDRICFWGLMGGYALANYIAVATA